MKNYISLDGNKIEISKETADNFRKEFSLDKYDRFLEKYPEVYYGGGFSDRAFRTAVKKFPSDKKSRNTILVPTPSTNNAFYKSAFNWTINFVKEFPETYIWISSNQNLYILLPDEK